MRLLSRPGVTCDVGYLHASMCCENIPKKPWTASISAHSLQRMVTYQETHGNQANLWTCDEPVTCQWSCLSERGTSRSQVLKVSACKHSIHKPLDLCPWLWIKWPTAPHLHACVDTGPELVHAVHLRGVIVGMPSVSASCACTACDALETYTMPGCKHNACAEGACTQPSSPANKQHGLHAPTPAVTPHLKRLPRPHFLCKVEFVLHAAAGAEHIEEGWAHPGEACAKVLPE